MLYSEAWQDHTDILIFVISIFTLINLHFLCNKKKAWQKWSDSLQSLQWCHPKVLTCGGRKERHGFRFFSVIVDRQVPDARVHVLNKTCVMSGDRYQTALHSRRPLHTSDILNQEPSPIQEFYEIELQTVRELRRNYSNRYRKPIKSYTWK